jgi:F-type H+-transporting ATPase subunit delta
MNDSKIPVRYAKAILGQAKEENILGEVKNNLEFLGLCISQIPELRLLLEIPVVRTSEKKKIMEKSVGQQINPLTLSFLNLIFEQKREEFLASIIRHFVYLYNREMGIRPALLLTPGELDPAVRENIANIMARKLKIKIELKEQTDEKLLGGFIFRIEDRQIDASVASQLSRIRKELIHRYD